MLFVTDLGSTAGYLAFVPILWWGVSWRLGLRVFAVLVMSVYVNSVLKDLIALPRPFVYADIANLRVPSTVYSFPSGHAQQAAVFWGLLAAHARRTWFTMAAILLVALIGISRVYLGVHYPSDVVAGWCLGGAFVWVAMRYQDTLAERAAALPFGVRLGAGFLAPVMLAVAYPEVNAATAMGGLSGALGGWVIAQRIGLYPEEGNRAHRRAWLLVGIAGAPFIWWAVATLSQTLESIPLRQWVRFAAISLWVSLLAPLLASIVTGRETNSSAVTTKPSRSPE